MDSRTGKGVRLPTSNKAYKRVMKDLVDGKLKWNDQYYGSGLFDSVKKMFGKAKAKVLQGVDYVKEKLDKYPIVKDVGLNVAQKLVNDWRSKNCDGSARVMNNPGPKYIPSLFTRRKVK